MLYSRGELKVSHTQELYPLCRMSWVNAHLYFAAFWYISSIMSSVSLQVYLEWNFRGCIPRQTAIRCDSSQLCTS